MFSDSEKPKGWYDLSPSEFVEAVSNLNKKSLKETDPVTLNSRISEYQKDGKITEEEAQKVRDHLESLRK